MKKYILLIMVLFVAALPAAAAVKRPVEWAVKVNNDKISMGLFNKRVETALKEISKNTSIEAADEQALIKDTRKSILEQMIEAVILLQWADREGLEIKEKTIKAKIAEIKRSFPSATEFRKSLAEQEMTVNDLERDVKRQIIEDKLIEMRAKALAVSDEEINAFYDKNIDLYVQKEKLADVKGSIRKFLLQEKSRAQYLKDLQEEKANAKIILNEKLGELFYPVTSQEAAPHP